MNTAIFINPHLHFCLPLRCYPNAAFKRACLQSLIFTASPISLVMEGGASKWQI